MELLERAPVLCKQRVRLAYGLKYVAPFAGHTYSAENAGGAQSIVWFHQYQRDPNRSDVLEKLLTYNKEDCVAMRTVEDWL